MLSEQKQTELEGKKRTKVIKYRTVTEGKKKKGKNWKAKQINKYGLYYPLHSFQLNGIIKRQQQR